MNTQLVSVIIPSHNAALYIRDAIASVIRQTYQQCEVIVIDDGSSDGTEDIVAQYATVKYVRQHHLGVSAARNLGIRLTKGPLVAFLDADDYWLPDKLSRQVRFLSDHPQYGMVFTEHTMIDAQGNTLCITDKRPILNGDPVRNIFLLSNIGTPTVMVRRAVLDAVGPFDESLHCAEDENLWMRIAMEFPVALIPSPLVMVRRHNNNLTRRPDDVLKGVSKHLEVLHQRYPKIAERIRDLPRLRQAQLHFSAGLEHLARNSLGAARKEFSSAIQNRVSVSRMLYWLACFLPLPVFEMLRSMRRYFRKSVYSKTAD